MILEALPWTIDHTGKHCTVGSTTIGTVRVVVAPDKFRGSASAAEVAAAMAGAVTELGAVCEQVPVADGGEGFLEALGGPNRVATVTGPLGDHVEAPWRLVRGVAVIEMALASGLGLAGGAEGNDAVAATSYGTGELIAAAVDAGAHRVLVGMGGSACTDGGFGALRALYPHQRLRGVEIIVGCDVRIPFTRAADIFAPAKGATPTQVELLRRRLERLAQVYETDHGVDVEEMEGSGAAGGLAGGLAAIGAELASGFDMVAEELDLFERITGADLVITGEGFMDQESFDGKAVGGVVSLAADAGVPVLVVVGDIDDPVRGRVDAVSLVERFGPVRAFDDVTGCVAQVVSERLDEMSGHAG